MYTGPFDRQATLYMQHCIYDEQDISWEKIGPYCGAIACIIVIYVEHLLDFVILRI